jgi:hypothetical protein
MGVLGAPPIALFTPTIAFSNLLLIPTKQGGLGYFLDAKRVSGNLEILHLRACLSFGNLQRFGGSKNWLEV